MSQRVYVDTNIWIDCLEDRHPDAGRFFHRALDCKYHVVASDLVFQELATWANPGVLLALLEGFEKLTVVHVSAEDEATANRLPTHRADAVHAAVAIRLGIPLLTANVRDFLLIPRLEVWQYADIS